MDRIRSKRRKRRGKALKQRTLRRRLIPIISSENNVIQKRLLHSHLRFFRNSDCIWVSVVVHKIKVGISLESSILNQIFETLFILFCSYVHVYRTQHFQYVQRVQRVGKCVGPAMIAFYPFVLKNYL